MKSILVAWNWLTLLSLFIFPQLLGVLLYFRLSRLPGWIARIVGVLGPALAFFYLSPLFFFAELRQAHLNGAASCGMPALAAAFMILFGTAAQFCTAVAIHILLVRRGSVR